MADDRDDEPLSFVGRRLPEALVARSVSIAAGCDRPYEHNEWAGAIIVVEEGEIELECLGGSCARFGTGAVLFFDSLPLRTVRNTGRGPTLLIAVSRRGQQSSSLKRRPATAPFARTARRFTVAQAVERPDR